MLKRRKAVRDAAASMAEVLELAERTEKLHEAAGVDVPERLGTFLGRSVVPSEQHGLSRPVRPVETEAGWMWRPVGECLPITLLRALSRMNSTGMRSQELLERMLFLNVDVHYGPVAFAAQRLEARRLIRREADWSWTLTPPIEAGVMYQGMLWGAVGSLAAAEQTASAGWVVRVAGRWAA